MPVKKVIVNFRIGCINTKCQVIRMQNQEYIYRHQIRTNLNVWSEWQSDNCWCCRSTENKFSLTVEEGGGAGLPDLKKSERLS